jgi:hypothetical protein
MDPILQLYIFLLDLQKFFYSLNSLLNSINLVMSKLFFLILFSSLKSQENNPIEKFNQWNTEVDNLAEVLG